MRALVLFIIAAALLQLSFAESLESFTKSSFEPDQSVQALPLNAQSGSFVLLLANGSEIFVFDLSSGTPLADPAKIQQVLTEDLYARANYDKIYSDAAALPALIEDAKNDGESMCMRYTGLEMYPCTDRDSCAFACKAVPQCDSGLLYAAGSWESMLGWNNKMKEFNSTLAQFGIGLDSMHGGGSAIDAKVAVLDSLLSIGQNISGNSLFLNRTDEGCTSGERRCFEYCPKINYSLTSLSAMRSSLLGLKSGLSTLSKQPERAASVANATRQYQEYLASRASKLSALKYNTDAEVSLITLEYSKAGVRDAQIEARIVLLSNLSSSLAAQGDAGYVRAALLRQKDFDSSASALHSDIKALSANKISLGKDILALEEKIQKSSPAIGNATAQSYEKDLAAISASSSKPNLTASNITALRKQASDLNSQLDKQIVDSTLSGAGAQKPSGSAAGCPLAAGMVALAALAAFAKKK